MINNLSGSSEKYGMETWVVRSCTEKVKTGLSFFKGLGTHPWFLSWHTHTHTNTHSPFALPPGSFPHEIKACLCFYNLCIISLPLTQPLILVLRLGASTDWGLVLWKAPKYKDKQVWWMVGGFRVWCFMLNLIKLPILDSLWPTQWPFHMVQLNFFHAHTYIRWGS